MKYDSTLIGKVKNHGTYPGIDTNVYTHKVAHIDDLKIINRRYMGAGMSQSYSAIYFFEYLYESFRFEYIVEIGSQKGALSTYFANLAGITESVFFDTFEINPNQDWYHREVEGAGHWFNKLVSVCPFIHSYHQNIFTKDSYHHIKSNVDQFKSFIFCDGGNKIREFNLYSTILKSGDVIGVHDWNIEINNTDIQQAIEQCNLEPIINFNNSADQLGTNIQVFQKK